MTQQQAEQAAEHSDSIVREIRRTLRGLVVATLILFVAIAGVGTYAYIVADQNRQAVCNLRTDLKRRVHQSEEFVAKHPQKIKELGFTKAQVAHEIENQRRTLDALSAVSCG